MGSEAKLRCPSCGGPDVRHSQRRGMVDSIMTMLRKSPYRCRQCRRRFYHRDNCKPEAAWKQKRKPVAQTRRQTAQT